MENRFGSENSNESSVDFTSRLETLGHYSTVGCGILN